MLPLSARWDGGLGYARQKRMFSAIVKFGWDKVRHYILFDGLEKGEAELIEAALIREWKTTMRGKGYNSVQPNVDGFDTFVVPKFNKIQIEDCCKKDVEERFAERVKRTNEPWKYKQVRLIETGEIFASATAAAREMFVTPGSISRAARKPGATCGTCWIEDTDEGWRMEVPAHWEYITTSEEKEGLV